MPRTMLASIDSKWSKSNCDMANQWENRWTRWDRWSSAISRIFAATSMTTSSVNRFHTYCPFTRAPHSFRFRLPLFGALAHTIHRSPAWTRGKEIKEKQLKIIDTLMCENWTFQFQVMFAVNYYLQLLVREYIPFSRFDFVCLSCCSVFVFVFSFSFSVASIFGYYFQFLILNLRPQRSQSPQRNNWDALIDFGQRMHHVTGEVSTTT